MKRGSCSNCENHTADYSNVEEFKTSVAKMRNKKSAAFKELEYVNLTKTLIQSLLFPELSKGAKLPSAFQVPTYSLQLKSSFTVTPNAAGNALVQIIMGQFLSGDTYFTGVSLDDDAGKVVGYGAKKMFGETVAQNGNSPLGYSNVFVCNHASLDGTKQIDSTIKTTADNDTILMIPSPILRVGSKGDPIFSSVRPGPMSVKYEYISRLDAASGTVTAGINYTTVQDAATTATKLPGLLADPTYSTVSAIEDCPFSRTVPVSDSIKAIFIPHDFSALNMRDAKDASATVVPQRLSLLICGAISQGLPVARITITANFEGIPTRKYADIMTLSYNTYPVDLNFDNVYKAVIDENLVISKESSEFGLERIMDKIRAKSVVSQDLLHLY